MKIDGLWFWVKWGDFGGICTENLWGLIAFFMGYFGCCVENGVQIGKEIGTGKSVISSCYLIVITDNSASDMGDRGWWWRLESGQPNL